MTQRILWILAGLVAFAQAALYLAALVWPAASDVSALALRAMVLQALPLLALQLFVALPLAMILIWRARRGLERAILGLVLLAWVALVALSVFEGDSILRVMGDPTASRRLVRLIGLARWADAGLALAALIALRLAWRAESDAG